VGRSLRPGSPAVSECCGICIAKREILRCHEWALVRARGHKDGVFLGDYVIPAHRACIWTVSSDRDKQKASWAKEQSLRESTGLFGFTGLGGLIEVNLANRIAGADAARTLKDQNLVVIQSVRPKAGDI
jgi:hypothetical protein